MEHYSDRSHAETALLTAASFLLSEDRTVRNTGHLLTAMLTSALPLFAQLCQDPTLFNRQNIRALGIAMAGFTEKIDELCGLLGVKNAHDEIAFLMFAAKLDLKEASIEEIQQAATGTVLGALATLPENSIDSMTWDELADTLKRLKAASNQMFYDLAAAQPTGEES